MRAAPATAPSPAAPRAETAGASRHSSLGSALLLLGCVALAGEAAIQAVYTPEVLSRLTVLAAVALTGLLLGGARCRPPVWAIVLSALIGVRALAVAPPLDNVIAGGRLLTGVLVVAAVSAVPALLPLLRVLHTEQVAAVALAAVAAGYGLVVISGIPVIDVWALLQGAGQGLADGRNPYEMAFPASPPGQTDHCFTYLPATALLTAPGVWLGDARWAELVLLISAAAVLVWHLHRRGGARMGLAVLVVVLPGTIYLVQQSWTETLLLPALVATAVLADRGRAGWAAVAFGVALATKQHAMLLVPLLLLLCRFRLRDLGLAAGTGAALTVPWLLANPARFFTCTADFFLSAEPPRTSLSLWLHLPEPVRLPLLALALLGGYLLAARYCPRNGSGFLIGAAVVLLLFGLVNKQTFLNQWWLVAALVTAGLALGGRTPTAPVPATGSESAPVLRPEEEPPDPRAATARPCRPKALNRERGI
ncbi:MAG TPA: hypothetical protein VHH34_16795 [Pseudonocardiaceae bacterium]|nr:hypothetical protein [Pseudonocardiaceae bacterium]